MPAGAIILLVLFCVVGVGFRCALPNLLLLLVEAMRVLAPDGVEVVDMVMLVEMLELTVKFMGIMEFGVFWLFL